MSKTIVVLGATGEMGARVCRLVRRLAPTALLVGANRSGTGHAEFPIHQVDIADRDALLTLLENADMVINAVGPYDYDPAPIIHAAISARCHYTDLSENLAFIEQVEAVAEKRAAAKAGVVLIPGCSTVPGLVAALAGRWKMDASVTGVSAYLSMGSRNPVTKALLAGMIAPLGRRGPGGRWFSRVVSHETLDKRSLRFGSYPIALADSKLKLGARKIPVRFFMGFDRGWLNVALARVAPFMGRMQPAGLTRLAGSLLPFLSLTRPFGTDKGVLSVVAESVDGQEQGRVEVYADSHGLDIPALPAAWMVVALVRDGWVAAPGVRGLDRAITPEAAMAALVDAGYRVDYSPH